MMQQSEDFRHIRPLLGLAGAEERCLDLLAESTVIEGSLTLNGIARIHGRVRGTIRALPGSTVIIAERGLVEGEVFASKLIIAGCVVGALHVEESVCITATGRVIGDIRTERFSMQFGAIFDGQCHTRRPLQTHAIQP